MTVSPKNKNKNKNQTLKKQQHLNKVKFSKSPALSILSLPEIQGTLVLEWVPNVTLHEETNHIT